MTTSPFMDGYSSEDYGDSDDDYCLVPAAATSPQITVPIDDGPPSTDLQYLVIDLDGLELLEVASNLSETVYYDVQPALSSAVIADAATLEAENGVEEGDAMVESRYYEAVESDADLDPEDAIKEWSDSEVEDADAPTQKTELEVEEGDLPEESSETMDAHAALQPEDAIEEPNLEAEELDAAALEAENEVGEFNYEAVESDTDLEPEDPIEEWSNSEAEEANVPTLKAEIAVQEGDATEVTAKSVPVDADLDAEAAVEEGDATEKSLQALESDFVLEAKEENSVGEREDVFEGDAIGDATQESYEAKESDSYLEAEPEDVVEEDATKESDESLESDAALEAEKYAVEGDATQESYGAKDSDSDLEAEPEDVVEAGYATEESYESDYDLEWESEGEDGLEIEANPLSLYMRAELAVTESAQDSVMETFVGRSPMLMLQECRTALISAIDAFLSEIVLLRDRFRRFLGSVFRQREFLNSKYA